MKQLIFFPSWCSKMDSFISSAGIVTSAEYVCVFLFKFFVFFDDIASLFRSSSVNVLLTIAQIFIVCKYTDMQNIEAA